MQADFAQFKTATQAEVAEVKVEMKDLEVRLTSAVSSIQIRLMAWMLLLISVATGLLIALDRLFGPATGG